MAVKLLVARAKEQMQQSLAITKREFERAMRPVQGGRDWHPLVRKRMTDEYEFVINQLSGILDNPDYWNSNDAFSVNSTYFKNQYFGKIITGNLFLCQNAFFAVTGIYSESESKLLVQEKIRKMKSQVERLQNPSPDAKYERSIISETVRHEVWRRDQGKCVQCGSVYRLEFDHLIPVSKGGSNTARNLQLLCEPCNRAKSSKI